MKKYKRKRNSNLIKIFLILLVGLLTMTIGYSLFSDTLYIQGTANIKYNVEVQTYTVIFNANGGNGTMVSQIFEIDEAKALSKNSFVKDNYEFMYWTTQPDGTGTRYYDGERVKNLTNTGGDTITLYANYDRVKYDYDGDYVFDGTNYINTEVKLFSDRNVHRDFIVSFEIENVNSVGNQAALMNTMDESGNPWPGIVFRVYNQTQLELVANVNNNEKVEPRYPNTTSKVVLERINDVLYITINDGERVQLIDYTNLLRTFDVPTTFGASLDGNLNPMRYFNGTLSNMHVELLGNIGKIKYYPNGGNGTTQEETVTTDGAHTLKANTYTRPGAEFIGWNTSPDGTGTSYANGANININASEGEEIELYAQWNAYNYKVRFFANGGTGTMQDQEFESGVPSALSSNTFTREGNTFIKWNTSPDGTGTSYTDGQNVVDLGSQDGEIVKLYAFWSNVYEYPGDIVFTGNNYVDTGINLFSAENINKDFEISFEIKNYTYTANQATLLSVMDETGNPWPGLVFRILNQQNFEINANVTGNLSAGPTYPINTTNKVTLKRINNILYVSINDGADQLVVDYSTILNTFDVPVTFGASLNGAGNPMRYFTGTLSNLKVTLSN